MQHVSLSAFLICDWFSVFLKQKALCDENRKWLLQVALKPQMEKMNRLVAELLVMSLDTAVAAVLSKSDNISHSEEKGTVHILTHHDKLKNN